MEASSGAAQAEPTILRWSAWPLVSSIGGREPRWVSGCFLLVRNSGGPGLDNHPAAGSRLLRPGGGPRRGLALPVPGAAWKHLS
jgi:hypothetical protein